MEQQEFKIGDLVELKSGSPKLIVSQIDNYHLAASYWDYDSKDDKKIKHTGLFKFELFIKVKESES